MSYATCVKFWDFPLIYIRLFPPTTSGSGNPQNEQSYDIEKVNSSAFIPRYAANEKKEGDHQRQDKRNKTEQRGKRRKGHWNGRSRYMVSKCPVFLIEV